jgi:thioredoxin-like negative regulator of GroEL
MKSIPVLLFVVALILSIPSFAAGPSKDKADPADTARKTGRVVIADFTLGLCKMCKQQKAILDELLPLYGDKVVLQVVMMNKETAVADRYGVSMIPTLLFFDATGKLAGRFDGVVTPKDKIEKQLSAMGVSK